MQKRIGDLFMELGWINQSQLDHILDHSKRTGLRLGDSAIDLGYITRNQLIKQFGKNFKVDFFYLNASYLPQTTKALLKPQHILKFAVLPLGFKKQFAFFKSVKVLNLGMVNPSDLDALKQSEESAKKLMGDESFHKIKPYLILADQLLEVLRVQYGINDQSLAAKSETEIHPTLQLFLDPPAKL